MTNLDSRVHDPSTLHVEDFAPECANGTCNCAPTCPNCRKIRCWDAKVFPGYHDWKCGECFHSFTMPWKAA